MVLPAVLCDSAISPEHGWRCSSHGTVGNDFAFMPFLDRSRIPGGAHYRPIYRIQFLLFMIDIIVLGYVGYVPPTAETILLGQIGTVYYFGSFILLPLISKAEDKWLFKRGLPPRILALIASEEKEKDKRSQR